jgi:hypothetical protein
MDATVRRWMAIIWPAFLSACALELMVFALVDPSNLHWRGEPVGLSTTGVYTLAFFMFWLAAVASSALTLAIGQPARSGSIQNAGADQ